MNELIITTKNKKEVVDITQEVSRLAAKNFSGLCHVFVKHTTAGVTTADLDPGTDLDYLDAFAVLMPKLNYRHQHNPPHVVDHILASLIGPSVIVPVFAGELSLGTWQRIVLIELDGPRDRELALSFIPGEKML